MRRDSRRKKATFEQSTVRLDDGLRHLPADVSATGFCSSLAVIFVSFVFERRREDLTLAFRNRLRQSIQQKGQKSRSSLCIETAAAVLLQDLLAWGHFMRVRADGLFALTPFRSASVNRESS